MVSERAQDTAARRRENVACWVRGSAKCEFSEDSTVCHFWVIIRVNLAKVRISWGNQCALLQSLTDTHVDHFPVLLQYNVQPGRKGMIELLGQVPSWITFQEKERVTVSFCYLKPCAPASWHTTLGYTFNMYLGMAYLLCKAPSMLYAGATERFK